MGINILVPFMKTSLMFFLFTSVSFAQKMDLGSWNIVNYKLQFSKEWSAFGEAQLRSLKFYDHFHYYEIKGGINFKVYNNVAITLAGGSYQTYNEGGDFVLPKSNAEWRLWPQLILLQNIKKLKLEQRYRAEFRFTSNGFRNRFRYRFGAAFPFGKAIDNYKPFQIGFSNELFFTNRVPYFERNRMLLALNYKISKKTTLQVGYLHQFDYQITDETGRDFLQVGIFIERIKK